MSARYERRRLPREEHPPAGEAPETPQASTVVRGRPAAPLPELPLPVPLPPGFYDDPGYVLRPYAFVGCAAAPRQFGVLGTLLRDGRMVAMGYDGAFAHGYFGPPGSGKSYLEGVQVEAALVQNRYQSRLHAPLCAVSLCHGRGGGGAHGAELLSARLPNQAPAEVRRLLGHHGTRPEGIGDVLCLCPPRRVDAIAREHPHVTVLPLRLLPEELGAAGLRALLWPEAEDEGSLLEEELAALLAWLPPGAGRQELLGAIAAYPFRDEHARRLAARRAELAAPFLSEPGDPALRSLLRPGRLVVIDVRDAALSRARALGVLRAILDVLVFGEGGPPCGLLLCLDEAHKLLGCPPLRHQIEHIIRERRHLRVSVILCNQDAREVPPSTLAELDGVGLFPGTSERALRHLAQDVAAFGDVTTRDLAALAPGQLLLWSRRIFSPYGSPYEPAESLDDRILRLCVRPRLSHHGGATRPS